MDGMSDRQVFLTGFVMGRHMANKHKHEAIPSFDVSNFVE
jgi:hypothetical protein